ncbi:hypothetical protein HMPREF1991_02302 [Hoylesella loescheii DSM 19665 = JCM 12249 = ATCC 15930]|uniref:Uncharacterized protein n=1 Tax=Hoylesella loescheii DSM 19665 = JCM 12249 = ATCC 15930 TaxID=1122985 RepID=A0A069QFK6_HOYLO|nr:hypothetical protein HMPREF1991_02302 [Hoylesella loescheii DSM 19665 = JCM 12249 = ATCC 15930]
MKANWLLASTSRSRAALCLGVDSLDTTDDLVLQEVHISGVSVTARAKLTILTVDFRPVMRCNPLRAHAIVVLFFFIITVCFLVVNAVIIEGVDELTSDQDLLKVKRRKVERAKRWFWMVSNEPCVS